MNSKLKDVEVEGPLPQPHPLLIHHVLTAMFRYMDAVDLVNCRSVCQDWFTAAGVFLQERIDQIKIRFRSIEEVSEYLNHIRSGTNLRFSNFHLDNIPLEDGVVEEFFEEIGRDIKILDIGHHVDLKKIEGLPLGAPAFGSILLTRCPKLKSLSLHLAHLDHGLMNYGFIARSDNLARLSIENVTIIHCKISSLSYPILFDLFRICPLLKEVTVAKEEGTPDSSQYNAAVIQALVDSKKLSQLTSLTLSLWDEYNMPRTAMKKMQLKHFQSKVKTFSRELINFLASQRDFLDSLIISGLSPSRNPDNIGLISSQSHFPKLRLLKLRFKLSLPSSKRDIVLLPPIRWDVQFPSLTSLVLKVNKDGGCNLSHVPLTGNLYTIFASRSDPCLTLTSLQIPLCLHYQGDAEDGILALAGPHFPNLRHLSVGYQGRGRELRNIWRNWPQLETLFINAHPPPRFYYGGEDNQLGLEELLTGFDPEQMKLAANSATIPEPPAFPSIINLKKLRELTIHGGFERDSGFTTGREGGRDKIGDITFTHAFSKMGSLQYLHITVENDVSGIAKMKECCPHLKLRFSPDRDFIHLQADHFHGAPHKALEKLT